MRASAMQSLIARLGQPADRHEPVTIEASGSPSQPVPASESASGLLPASVIRPASEPVSHSHRIRASHLCRSIARLEAVTASIVNAGLASQQ